MTKDRGFEEEFQERRPVEHEILRCRIGSQAYGTALPTSDEDFKGIYIPSAHHLLGIGGEARPKRFSKDDQSHPLRLFAQKASKCVPNVLELLFCEDEDVVFAEEEGLRLRTSRDLFLSKRCIAPYIGYAEAQLREAAKKPTNRGQGRLDLVEKFGYDTKFAMHTIRLLQTAEEMLTTGRLSVRRPNAGWLITIRLGQAFSGYEDFHAFATQLISHLRSLEDTAPMREEPDDEAISRLVIDLHRSYWARHPEIA